ncbi:MAG TPA: hypothetical protein VLR93_10720 [Patescibacteria group bacterium]|nr:hypothetical protein [Patescibacteria group bacterium]
MTRPIDVERELDRWFSDGPDVVADRVIDAALTVIETTTQRSGPLGRPWRFLPMTSPRAAAVALVAVVAIGGFVIFTNLPSAPAVGGTPAAPPTSSPAPSPTAKPSPSGPPDASGPLAPRTAYRAVQLSQPLTFVMPDGFPASSVPVTGDPWPDGHTLRVYSKGYSAVTIHDDIPIAKDLCDPTQGLIDLPPTPDAIGAWLSSASEATLSKKVDVTVDGRTGYRWDLTIGAGCKGDQVAGAAIYMSAREHHRLYAIPTGTDTILVVTWPDSDENALDIATDQLVTSMTFP